MWADLWFDELEPLEKLLFIYLITNSKTNLLGIYDHTPRRISIDTRIPEKEVKEMLDKFQNDGKVYFSDGWIWIVNWLKNQKWNPKMVASILKKYFSLEESIIESFTKLSKGDFDMVLESIDSLSICYQVPMDKYVKGKEVNNENLKNEKGKVEVGKEEIENPEKLDTSTLPVVLNELLLKEGFSQSTIDLEFQKFNQLNIEKGTTWKDEKHQENAFKGWMKKAKKDNAGLSEQYYQVIKDHLEGIRAKAGAKDLSPIWIRYQFEEWGKLTTKVIHNQQNAVDDFTEWLKVEANNAKKPPSGMSLYVEDVEETFNLGRGNAKGLVKMLYEIKCDQVRISKGVPPAFYNKEEDLQKHLYELKSVTQDLYQKDDFEAKWDSHLNGKGIERKEIIEN